MDGRERRGEQRKGEGSRGKERGAEERRGRAEERRGEQRKGENKEERGMEGGWMVEQRRRITLSWHESIQRLTCSIDIAIKGRGTNSPSLHTHRVHKCPPV